MRRRYGRARPSPIGHTGVSRVGPAPAPARRWPELHADQDSPTLYYLGRFSDKLHTVIKQAAARNKVRFADGFVPKGHDACAAPAQHWVEGAEPASPAVQFHANAAGMQAQAKLVLAALGRR
jgi:hypothetical protein